MKTLRAILSVAVLGMMVLGTASQAYAQQEKNDTRGVAGRPRCL
mgnify:CR=1 FL=1